jgi:hypothetical protein
MLVPARQLQLIGAAAADSASSSTFKARHLQLQQTLPTVVLSINGKIAVGLSGCEGAAQTGDITAGCFGSAVTCWKR